MMPLPTHLRYFVAGLAALVGGAAAAQATLPGPNASTAPSASATPTEGEMSAELMYRLLVGDVALQRGELGVAARAYFEAARESGSPAVARRATEVGLASRQRGMALEAARLWAKLEPDAERPRHLIAALGTGSGNPNRAMELAGETGTTRGELEKALAKAAESPETIAEAFLELNRLLAHSSDKAETFRLVSDLAQPYPGVAEAHFAVALAGFATGVADRATSASSLAAIDRALTLKPSWDRAALLKAEILGKASPPAAIAWLVSFRATQPESKPVAGALAQFYIADRRYADARAVFEELYRSDPQNRDLEFGLAALAVQMKDWAAAEQLLGDLQQAGYGETGVVDSYLAQVAEETGRYELAFERYRAVPDSDRGWLARLRAAAMLAKLNRVAEAREFLANLPAVTIEQRVQVRQADAQLLRDAGAAPGAYTVLEKALAEHPDEPDLLYDSAMVAEKLDKLDVAEKRLVRLIELKPDSAQALNSLGYTLVDRTPRAAEGFALIEKAHKLAPNDPFILDSMGWALFRLGRLAEAETYLRRALADRPDAEIAAHLGEVLWAKGDRERAREVWQSQLRATPDNAALQDTVRRLDR